jgi:large subunit ribosomal protein L37Ae
MSQGTKKVGSTGRFGPRYGVSVRRRVGSVEKKQKQKHECPSCSKINVKRVSTGIFKCSSCDYQFASGAYYPAKVE